MHVLEWLWDYLDTCCLICIACCCTEFYDEVSKSWKNVVISESIPIDDSNLMPILICAQNIETLRINFEVDIEGEKDSESMILKIMERYTDTDTDSVEKKKKKKKEKKRKAIKFPSTAMNPSYLPHLKKLNKIDFKSCGSLSYESFISAFFLQLSKFVTLKHLCIPQLFSIRHNCLEILEVAQLQIGFDGMNIHLGADLIGITHLKKQLPKIEKIFCDELYLFIGEDIYINHDKSGKQYWFAMRKWCNNVMPLQIIFKNPAITIMLMSGGLKKKTPPLIYEQWPNIQQWFQDRIGDFISMS